MVNVTAYLPPHEEAASKFKADALFIPGVHGLYHVALSGPVYIVHSTDGSVLDGVANLADIDKLETTNHPDLKTACEQALGLSMGLVAST